MFGLRCLVWLVCRAVSVWETCRALRWATLSFGLKCGICVNLVLTIMCMLLTARSALVTPAVSIIPCRLIGVGLTVVCRVVRLSLLRNG